MKVDISIKMSVSLVSSALLVLAGLTWLGNGLVNERQFCDLYCSLTDILPKQVVNVLFILLGLVALGFATMMVYQYFKKDEKEETVEIQMQEDNTIIATAPLVAENSSTVTATPLSPSTLSELPLEGVPFADRDIENTKVSFRRGGGCCGR